MGKYWPTDARKGPSDLSSVINFGKCSNISNHGVWEGLTILFRSLCRIWTASASEIWTFRGPNLHYFWIIAVILMLFGVLMDY